jgi:hypothetical protein
VNLISGQTFPGTVQTNVANTFTQPQTINGTTSSLTANASDPNGVGLFGFATANSHGSSIGVEGVSLTDAGIGIDGFGAIGVAGSSSTPQGRGVKGGSSGGVGVEGIDATGIGVAGTSTSGRGVFGASTNGPGVRGESPNDVGVEAISKTGWGVYGASDSGIGVQGAGNSGYGVQGTSQTLDGVNGVTNAANVSGVAGINNTSGTGVYGLSNGGYGFKTPNHVSQDRGMSGWVKAMVYVDPFTQNGTAITRCFNSQTGGPSASTPPCGFSVTHRGQGNDVVDFGFQVNDRFISASSADVTLTCVSDPHTCPTLTSSQVVVATGTFGGSPIDTAFWIIVY